MKIYKKPEIEIVEFDITENVTQDLNVNPSFGGPAVLDLESDEVFYGAEEGYIVE